MRVLITGAAGFLGKECAKLFKENAYHVITTDKLTGVDLQGDLSDAQFTASLPDVDLVINCAAVQYVSKDLPIFFRNFYFNKNNILTAKNLCERYKNTSAHLIHLGTSMMYKQTGQELYSLDSTMGGEGVYSISKLQAQTYIDQFPGSATVIPCIIGGEGREGLFIGFVKMMKKFGFVLFPGQGRHKIHMVHVSDVADLIMVIAQKRAAGLYNAAAPEPLSIRQWIEEIQDELKIKQVTPVSIPLLPVKLISQALLYRVLAREQLLMLKYPHVLDIKESLAIGWKPKFTNAQIARDIAVHISREMS